MPKQTLAKRSEDVVSNVLRFEKELSSSVELRTRLGHAHAFYATKDSAGEWKFAPSKFAGYHDNTAKKYLASAGGARTADGRETERHLAKWFMELDPESRFGRELFSHLEAFLGRWGSRLRKGARINILKSDLEEPAFQLAKAANDWLSDRISIDSRVCGGRPCIAGTRVRVSDILSMLAENASEQEILNDFPYLTHTDIAAALAYGARAADHRVIRAA